MFFVDSIGEEEMILFETTLITQRPCPTLGNAIMRGTQQISEDEDDKLSNEEKEVIEEEKDKLELLGLG